MKLDGKTAVVTGGGRGIGRTIALALAKEGADIATFSRTESEIKSVNKEILSLGRNSIAMVADVRKSSDVKRVFKEALKKFGKIDILINNAGIAMLKLHHEMTEKEWDAIIDTNLKGVFLCCKEVLPNMLKQKSGVIVNISSGAGKTGFPEFSAYSASKFGVIGFTESIAHENENKGIRVYAVCPGSIDTKLYWSLYPKRAHERLGRPLLKPEYVAEKVLQLCLPSCNIRSGSTVEIYE
jgi:NAD(P)-dependent dehydrogenase (short-subunit alcohol dehydrogenase family)